MLLRKRRRIEPTEDWTQLQLQLAWPEQVTYELIRPVVVFGFSPAERAQQTGVPARTIYRRADRFDAEGMTRSRMARSRLLTTFAPNDPQCCPSQAETQIYRLDGKLLRVS